MVGLLRPEDLKMIASDAEMAEVGKEDRLKKQKALQEVELREAFMSRQFDKGLPRSETRQQSRSGRFLLDRRQAEDQPQIDNSDGCRRGNDRKRQAGHQ